MGSLNIVGTKHHHLADTSCGLILRPHPELESSKRPQLHPAKLWPPPRRLLHQPSPVHYSPAARSQPPRRPEQPHSPRGCLRRLVVWRAVCLHTCPGEELSAGPACSGRPCPRPSPLPTRDRGRCLCLQDLQAWSLHTAPLLFLQRPSLASCPSPQGLGCPGADLDDDTDHTVLAAPRHFLTWASLIGTIYLLPGPL